MTGKFLYRREVMIHEYSDGSYADDHSWICYVPEHLTGNADNLDVELINDNWDALERPYHPWLILMSDVIRGYKDWTDENGVWRTNYHGEEVESFDDKWNRFKWCCEEFPLDWIRDETNDVIPFPNELKYEIKKLELIDQILSARFDPKPDDMQIDIDDQLVSYKLHELERDGKLDQLDNLDELLVLWKLGQ